MLNRRGFLGSMVAAFALDPERALWVPGAKTISIPKTSQNVIIMPDELVACYLANLHSNLVLARRIGRDFDRRATRIGVTLEVRRPTNFKS